jgi:predicted lipoprotein
MQIGSVFKGTAIRDCFTKIKFGDFENQSVFLEISNAIHINLNDNLFSSIDVSTLTGKTIEFYGAITDNGSTEILITPFAIEVKSEAES